MITFSELLDYVWQCIEKSENQEEMIKILDEQIQDAECMCFTGRFNRTLSVLQGFYDDVNITISSSSQISAIVLAAREKFEGEELKQVIVKELKERGYREEEYVDWINALDD